jgi:DNA repair protein RadC
MNFSKTCRNRAAMEISGELLNIEQVGKTIFCEYCKLLSLYLTIPTTTATAERSFSALNRIKTYLRCTMTQQRLNHVILFLIYI